MIYTLRELEMLKALSEKFNFSYTEAVSYIEEKGSDLDIRGLLDDMDSTLERRVAFHVENPSDAVTNFEVMESFLGEHDAMQMFELASFNGGVDYLTKMIKLEYHQTTVDVTEELSMPRNIYDVVRGEDTVDIECWFDMLEDLFDQESINCMTKMEDGEMRTSFPDFQHVIPVIGNFLIKYLTVDELASLANYHNVNDGGECIFEVHPNRLLIKEKIDDALEAAEVCPILFDFPLNKGKLS